MQAANSTKLTVCFCLASALLVVIYLSTIDCAPNGNSNGNGNNSGSNGNKNNGGRGLIRSGGLLSNLFRRQTTTSSSNSNNEQTTTAASATSASPSAGGSDGTGVDFDDAQTQTEMDAQKLLDSLPNANSNSGPSTFRERVSESFGVLREGVSNQFRALRDSWSDTVDDLRDTWSSGSD